MEMESLRSYIDIDSVCVDVENLISAAQSDNVRDDLIQAFDNLRNSLGILSTAKGKTEDDYVHGLILDCLKVSPLIKEIAKTQNLPPIVFERCKKTYVSLGRLVAGITARVDVDTQGATA